MMGKKTWHFYRRYLPKVMCHGNSQNVFCKQHVTF